MRQSVRMTTRGLLELLADEHGLSVTDWELRGMIRRGEIPRPRLNSSLNFTWTGRDVRRIAKVLGRKEAATA